MSVPETRRRRLWIAAAAAVLTVGVGASVVGGVAWENYQRAQTQKSVDEAASGASSAVVSALRRDLDLVAVQQGMVASFPSLTNRDLAAWYRSIDLGHRYPGILGIGLFEPVSLGDLPTFEAQVQADPPPNESVDPYVVFPPGVRAGYCLQRFGIQTLAGLPPGLDLCAPTGTGSMQNPFPQVLREATDTGRLGVVSFRTILKPLEMVLGPHKARALLDRFAVLAPVYEGGRTPTTVAGRESSLLGWISATFSATTLINSALGSSTNLGATLSYRVSGGGVVVMGSGGSVPTGAHLTTTSMLAANEPWRVVVTGSARSSARVQGLAVGAVGVALVILLSLFLTHLARSRERALRLVDERTGQLRHQALHDALTNLPNRALIFDRVQQMLLRARRQPLGVGALYVDLDNFKDINDTLGHHVGDELLRSVASRLASVLRASDTVGRLGGDEFLVLVEGDSLEVGPEMVAERLRAALGEPFELAVPEAVHIVVRASIGVAVGCRDSADELIRDADVALYQAKSAGRDRFVVFRPEMQTAVQDRLGLETDLREAIETGQLFLLYQPIFDLTTMAANGAEALVRWRHPSKGLIMPDDFIPLAEKTGLIVRLGRFVLNEACAQAARWHAQGYSIGVAVNVSARQLDSGSFADDVRQALDRSGIDASSLTLEIAETTLMHDTDTAARVLRELKEVGVLVSVDDFGTGHSSLSYLRQFPIDTLKIDRSYITSVSQTAESEAIIHTLIQLGKALGIDTLAEGVEEEAQLVRLKRDGCNSAQGFLLARPLAADAIATFFSRPSDDGVEPDLGVDAQSKTRA